MGLPTGWFVTVLIRETVPSSAFATQTEPPPTAIPLGSLPTGIVWLTVFVVGSMRETVLAAEFAAQIALAPYATCSGLSPTGIEARREPVEGSIAPTAFAFRRVSAVPCS